MRLSINPVAVSGYFASRFRHVRDTRRQARLHRELSRLPRYVANDIGVEDRYVNFVD